MNPTDFKVGDTIEMIESCGRAPVKGERLVVSERSGDLTVRNTRGNGCTCQFKWKLVSTNSLTPTSMSLLNSLRLLTKGEPQKTYQKVGIFDSNDMPGNEIVCAYVAELMIQDKSFFEKAKELLKEQESKK